VPWIAGFRMTKLTKPGFLELNVDGRRFLNWLEARGGMAPDMVVVLSFRG
jgi:hypothetical protein